MLIPNYDSLIKGGGNNFKQLYNYMPNKSFRLLICGPSGSGKTNALIHMLLKPLVYYDKVYLYAKNIDQEKYQLLFNELKKVAKNIKTPINKIYEYSNDAIKDVDELEDKLQKIVIFDDYICDKNQNQIIKYFIQGRHKNCSVIYLSQSYYKTDKNIRLNCDHFILYEMSSNREECMISKETGVPIEKYKKATKKQYNFLYIDKPNKTYKANFNDLI